MPATVLGVHLGPGDHASRPAANAAGQPFGALYSCTDHSLIYKTDGSSWATYASLTGTGIAATLADAAGDTLVATAADTWGKLTKGAAGTALISGASTISWVDVLPWHVSVIPMVWTPDVTAQGTWAVTGWNNQVVFPFYNPGSTANSGQAVGFANGAGAQNDSVGWDVILAAGTWDAHFWVRRSTNTGIITLNQAGASQGTVDTYAAAADAAKVSITGWTVATTGKKRMEVLMATKNGSSSGYVLGLFAIEFRRTA